MVLFLTSVRHPHNSNNYRRVEELLEISLRSVCRQTATHFNVIVVCNIRPVFTFKDARVTYHVVDFPPAAPEAGTVRHEPIVKRDKGTKKLSGLLLARQLDPDYVFFFDADDLVSHRIVEFANAQPGRPGWYVDAGYVVNMATWRMQRKYGLVRYCGSTLMPNARDLYAFGNLDPSLNETSSQDELLARATPTFVQDIVGDHVHMASFFARRNRPMTPFPFRAAVWMQETGENVDASKGTDLGVPLTQAFCEEFGVPVSHISPERPTAVDRMKESLVAARSRIGSLPVWRHI